VGQVAACAELEHSQVTALAYHGSLRCN
jgi:hypothetical protein